MNDNSSDIDYIMSDEVGMVISKGMAAVYVEKPEFPIDFLAKWLLNYCKTELCEDQVHECLQRKEKLLEKQMEKQTEIERKMAESNEKLQKKIEILEEFKNKIQSAEYHEEKLDLDLPEFIENYFGVTGVYIAKYDFPSKEMYPEEDDELAHLDTSLPKQLKYIGASKSHEFMKGKVLEITEGIKKNNFIGITGNLFKEKEEEQPPQEELNENGEPIEVIPQEKQEYIYVPSVESEPRMYFFRIPKLGAYMGLPLFYNSCLYENSFESAVEERQNFGKRKEDLDREREAAEIEFREMLKDKEELGEDTIELEREWEQKKLEYEEVVEAEFITQKKEFIVGVDTMGRDEEIGKEIRGQIEEVAKFFAKQWTEKEKSCLNNDVNIQLGYLESLGMPPSEAAENLVNEVEHYFEERQASLEPFQEDEKLFAYEGECLRLEKVKQQLFDTNIRKWILMLKQFRVIRFPGVLQGILYFMGYKKEEINIPGTNVLDWKHVRELINEDLLKKISKYNHRGKKSEEPEPYAKLNRLSARMQLFSREQIELFNLGYGRLYRWLVLTLNLRKQDIEVRKIQKEKQRKDIENKKLENEKIVEQKEQTLQEMKESLPPEELETFDEVEWGKTYDEEHPLHVIQEEEILDDIDLDLEREEEEEQEVVNEPPPE